MNCGSEFLQEGVCRHRKMGRTGAEKPMEATGFENED